MSTRPIPVTVLSGVLGAGKTTLVNHLLSNPGDRSIAVIVNDMGEVNVDAELIERDNADNTEGIIDLSNGCICCQLQDDLKTEAEELAATRDFDYLVVEASGISDPVPVAETFAGAETDAYRLDTMVTVLDTYGFWKALTDDGEIEASVTGGSDQPLSELLVTGVEFSNVVVMNKTDMVPEETVEELAAVVEQLQPAATKLKTTYSEVDPAAVLDTGTFDAAAFTQAPGWKQRLADAAAHDHGTHSRAAQHGVVSTVYRATEPFAPAALAEWLERLPETALRSKGVCYVAGTESVIGVSHAGPMVQAGPIGTWDPEEHRRTQLVLIGQDIDAERLQAELNGCLVDTETEPQSPADVFPIETAP